MLNENDAEMPNALDVEKIKTTEHYTTIKEYFLGMEKLNDATYAVLRYDHFDVEQLDEIEKQINQLMI